MLRLAKILVLAALLAGSAAAEEAAAPEPTRAERIDGLFADLAAAPSAPVGTAIARRIERLWMESGSPTIDLFMDWAMTATVAENYGPALDYLDQVALLAPEFAEVYNRRATVHYLAGNTSAALADVRRTLALEPRHFNALSGLGLMLERIDRPAEAYAAYLRALELNPSMADVEARLDELRIEVEGRPI